VIAPDLPKFGDASGEAGCRSIGEMAHSVLGLLDHLGTGDFIEISHQASN
jgi:hypothetical protein